MNPYAPTMNIDTNRKGSLFVAIWNAIVLLMAIGMLLLAGYVISRHYTRYVAGSDTQGIHDLMGDLVFFALLSVRDLTTIAGFLWVLVGISTFPLHRRPMLTRVVSLLLCIAAAFHPLSFTFTANLAGRSLVFLAIMSPMLLFGCGYPRCIHYALQIARRKLAGRDKGTAS